MKQIQFILIAVCLISGTIAYSQSSSLKIDPNPGQWTAFNRKVTFSNDEIYLNALENDGVLWINDLQFSNGTIELEIKGKDVRGKSFVGVAFHGKDDATFDGVYFRPFNFRSKEKKSNAVQYISMPEHDWFALRKAFPGKYENEIAPAPDPESWFHIKVVVDYPSVKAYVNGSAEPSLAVEQISESQAGKVGLWVGNGSDGWFRNVTIDQK